MSCIRCLSGMMVLDARHSQFEPVAPGMSMVVRPPFWSLLAVLVAANLVEV